MNNDLEQFEYEMELAEERRNTVIRIVCVIVSLLIAVGIFIAYKVVRADARNEASMLQAVADKYEAMLSPLISEKNSLENEIEAVTAKRDGRGLGMASVVFLFAEPSPRIFTDGAYDMLTSYGYASIVAVSDGSFPGDEGCMTVEEMKMLVGRGWEIAVSADADTDISALCERLADAGLPSPVTAYYPFGGYGENAAAKLADAGISSAILYMSDTEQDDSGIWTMAAFGSYENNVKKYYDSAIDQSDCLVLVTGFVNSREMFYDGNFSAMLSIANDSIESGAAINARFGIVRERYMAAAEKKAENEKECSEQLEKLTGELARISGKIDYLNGRRVAEIRDIRGKQ